MTLAACSHPSPVRVVRVQAISRHRDLPEPATTTTSSTTTTVTTVSRLHVPTWPRPPKAVRQQNGGGPCDRPSTCPQLRQCENGGSYEAGTSPGFYGAYQFADRSTWGMSPAEQDAHADEMYAQRGAQPWPVCGKYLR